MAQTTANDPIEHVVVLMLENQSFDRVLGCLKSVNADIDGVDPNGPGTNADPAGGSPYQQLPSATRIVVHDLGHDLDDVLRQMQNGCAGFHRRLRHKIPERAADRAPAGHELLRTR
jgi:phospholipase C